MTGPQVHVADELTVGVRVRPMFEPGLTGADAIPPHLLVESLDWESGFRGSGLRPDDRIVAVDGEAFAALAPETLKKQQGQWFGLYAEDKTWKARGRKEGDAVRVTVRRRRPPQGWETLEITGTLRCKRSYRDANNSPTLWLGGPNDYQRDGFGDGWPSWAEALRKKITWALCGGWRQTSMVTRAELRSLLEDQPRVDFLARTYPGPFADTVKGDYDAAVACLRGTAYPITESDLAFRRADEERVAEVAARGRAAWQACLAQTEAQRLPSAFPAEHPVFGKAKEIEGRLVLLEKLPTRNWISESGRNWLFAGDNDKDGWYFMDAEGDAALRMFRAVRRYRKLVAPDIREEYTVLARVLGGAGMLVINQSAHWGLKAEPVAAMVGDAMFVDLRALDAGGKESAFAGEDGLLKPRIESPPDDAAPQDVLAAMIAAIKAGDMTVWKSLFANWRVSRYPDGSPQVHWQASDLRDGAWEDSRRTLQNRGCDARVVWMGDVADLTTGREFEGAPHIQEVEGEIEHIGVVDAKAATPEYRAFKDVTVNRLWRLQRIDGGPWRIASAQNL
jgi:hypothetical protein